jgi:MauM/NapG family ferredoxin protein
VKSRPLGWWVVWIRRLVQGICLLLFLHLLLDTRTRPEDPPGSFHRIFFNLDPLALLSTWLAAHIVPAVLWLAVITLLVTLLFGRVFCGWVCPLGTIHAMASALRDAPKKILIQTGQWSDWQKSKYYLLAALMVMALFGVHWVGVFDPISLLVRSTTTALLPAVQYTVEEGANAIYQSDPHLGPLHLTSLTEPAYRFFRDQVFVSSRQAFEGGNLIFILFAVIVVLNLVRKRFWCRYICPLGALLGTAALRPAFRLVTHAETCGGCNLCTVNCQGGALPNQPDAHLPSECFVCWNCIPQCNKRAVSFEWVKPVKNEPVGRLNLSKRAFLASGLAGLGGVLVSHLSPQSQQRVFNPALIRPPGALAERDFLAKCLQCGLCMKACPTGGLQPTTFEAGWEGLWTPMLVPLVGYCEFNCNLCGQVCPTGAIQPLPIEEKKKIRVGLATVDTTRCLPYAYDRNCIVCEEHCPVPTKAIYFVQKEIPLREGGTRVVKQPKVDPNLCTGCGICENKCVFEDYPAIRVTSSGETRHGKNQPILVGPPSSNPTPPPAPADNEGNPYGAG